MYNSIGKRPFIKAWPSTYVQNNTWCFWIVTFMTNQSFCEKSVGFQNLATCVLNFKVIHVQVKDNYKADYTLGSQLCMESLLTLNYFTLIFD